MQHKRSRQKELAEKTYWKLKEYGVQTALKQVALKREKKYNALLAAVEAEAWKKVSDDRGSVNDVNDICTTAEVSQRKGVFSGPKSADRQCGEIAV